MGIKWKPMNKMDSEGTEETPITIEKGKPALISFQTMILRSDRSQAMVDIEQKKVDQSIGVWHELGSIVHKGVILQIKLAREEDGKIHVRKAQLSLSPKHWISKDLNEPTSPTTGGYKK